jgi:uncharacterized protein YjbI with pentapeptide repeats
MSQLTVHNTTIDIPSSDPDRDVLDALDSGIGILESFTYGDVNVRALDLDDLRLLDGEIRGVRAERGTWSRLRVDAVEIVSCDLPALTVTGCKFTRVKFTNCKLLGARFEDVTAEHLVFDRCKLDYATFEMLRAKAPIAFTNTALREARFARCEIPTAIFDHCELQLTEFESGSYRGLDLRDNDLATLRGVTNLRGIKLRDDQMLQLAHALAADLDIELDDEPEGWRTT